ESEGKTFHEIIDAAKTYGWHSFDHCLMEAFEANEVSEETALLYCADKGKMRRDIDLVIKRRGGPQLHAGSELKLQVKTLPPAFGHGSPTGWQVEDPNAAAQSEQTGAADSATKRRVIQPRTQTGIVQG